MATFRSWDSTEHKAKTRYFHSQFFERPNADNLLNSKNMSTKKVKRRFIFASAMDGLNLMPTVWWLSRLSVYLMARVLQKEVSQSIKSIKK